jgi:hypothetical protein
MTCVGSHTAQPWRRTVRCTGARDRPPAAAGPPWSKVNRVLLPSRVTLRRCGTTLQRYVPPPWSPRTARPGTPTVLASPAAAALPWSPPQPSPTSTSASPRSPSTRRAPEYGHHRPADTRRRRRRGTARRRPLAQRRTSRAAATARAVPFGGCSAGVAAADLAPVLMREPRIFDVSVDQSVSSVT